MTQATPPPDARRRLFWEACYNVRDLGGLPTTNGQTTRRRAIIRADLLGRLTAGGQQALLDYGMRTIIDLRAAHEVEQEPYSLATPAGNPATLTYLNLPLEHYYPHIGALIRAATSRAEVYCIVLDHYPDAVAAVMRAIINARPGGVVIHCHAGKDRTGIVSALLLSLAGVPAEHIAADYAYSQECLQPLYENMAAAAGAEEQVSFWLRPTATAEMMHLMLAHLDTKYGGTAGYLTQAGLSVPEIECLRNVLL